ncbi:hypothetical protein [Actinokineospora inagensis]|uniref:hypothetical protein n=1 Tax=Actinokineospora inagensis TaxID=103730 RepID=UPI0003FFEB4C|nr:hypothetical protein [Actinokineospora inagensis]
MSTISSASSTALAQLQQTQQTQGTHRHGEMRKAFDAAAKTLGMSTDDLRSALQSGQSMTSLAQSKGISTDALTSAISDALTSADSSLTADKAKEIAQRVVAGPGQGGPGGPGGAGGPGGPPPGGKPDSRIESALSSVAGALGMSDDDLKDALSSGQSLTDVAAANGMDADTLKTTLTTAISKADSSLSSDAVSALADKIIQGPPKKEQDNQTDRQGFDLSQLSSSLDSSSISKQLLSSVYSQQSSQLAAAGSWA